MVGEKPGDREDLAGHPFVGPAGRELDKALAAAGIDRRDVYITNAVKHFKFEERGKRRIHQTPKRGEMDACLPWLAAELEVVQPDVLVLLGATAGKALIGAAFKLGAARGRPVDSELAALVTATAHPSAILRAPDDESRHAARRPHRRPRGRGGVPGALTRVSGRGAAAGPPATGSAPAPEPAGDRRRVGAGERVRHRRARVGHRWRRDLCGRRPARGAASHAASARSRGRIAHFEGVEDLPPPATLISIDLS